MDFGLILEAFRPRKFCFFMSLVNLPWRSFSNLQIYLKKTWLSQLIKFMDLFNVKINALLEVLG